ncbi:MAG: phosphatase PAP2 family protein [Calditrichaceae bacterium]|nr:phosphatase PAP2 family protein [Calditrichaceae bacterium]MBN2708924.1 phosphatase PAP2 family protein [Calditrichaceae bacterium]RQV97552.1 MAG: phosphatase PAP2 family protein [Calditrichota bacterium]
MNLIKKIDVNLVLYIDTLPDYNFLLNIFRFLTWIGNGHLYFLIIIAEFLYPGKEDCKTGLILLTALALEIMIYYILKNSTKRLRPFDSLDNIRKIIDVPDKYSFPSGHTAAAFVMAHILSHQFHALLPVFYITATLIGISRIYLRAHYLTDVLTGALIGILSANLVLWIIQ